MQADETVAGKSQKTLHAFFGSAAGSSPAAAGTPSPSLSKRKRVGLSPDFVRKAEQGGESTQEALAALRPLYLAAKKEERQKAQGAPKRRVRTKST